MNIQEVREKYPQYNDLSDEQLAQALHGKYYSDIPYSQFADSIGLAKEPAKQPVAQEQATPEEFAFAGGMPTMGDLGNVVRNVGMGSLKKASDVGATLLMPPAELRQRLLGRIPPAQSRTADLKQFFAENADPNSPAFKTGELLTSIAATAGVPGALGKVATAAAPMLPASAAQFMPRVAAALESGGFRTLAPTLPEGAGVATKLANAATNAALRFGAGATVGGVSAGLLEPESAGTGAVIGGTIPVAADVAAKTGHALGTATREIVANTLGTSTLKGRESFRQAMLAKGSGTDTFMKNVRGEVPITDVLDEAKGALASMRAARGAEYTKAMAAINADKTALDITPIVKAVDKAPSGMYGDKVVNPQVVDVVQKMREKVAEWASADPAIYHTPQGLDQLKQAIGGIRETTQANTAARTAVNNVYHTVREQIVKQAPEYAKTMESYELASDLIDEIQRTFSLGEKAAADTAIRKLQSVMRNNVHTNYGARVALAEALKEHGAPNLMQALAGQSLNTWTGRGLGAVVDKGLLMAGPLMGHPETLLALPFTSPRLMGEAAYALGGMLPSPSAGQGLMSTVAPEYLGLMNTVPASTLPALWPRLAATSSP